MKEVSKLAKKLIPEYDGNQEIFLEFVTLWIDLKIGEEAFIRGVQDTLTANDMYDIAIQIGAGYSAGKMAGVLIKKMTAKYPKTIGTKLGSKAIPYVGWALGAYIITTATIENADLAQNCASSEDEIDGENTQYYCGKLMVNGILSLGGVAVSKIDVKGAYNSKNKILGRFSGEQKDLINEGLSPNFMDESILKKNLENPDTFIKSFKNGKYPNLKKIDTEGFVSGLKSVNGKIKLSNGHTPKSKSFNYVLISDNGDLKLIFGENHSYLSQGKNVQYAGNIKFTSSGNISYIDNGSGHYKPEYNDSNSKKQVLETMKDRFGIELNSSIFKEYKN